MDCTEAQGYHYNTDTSIKQIQNDTTLSKENKNRKETTKIQYN